MDKKIREKLKRIRTLRNNQIEIFEDSLMKILREDINLIDRTLKNDYNIELLIKRIEGSDYWIKRFLRKP